MTEARAEQLRDIERWKQEGRQEGEKKGEERGEKKGAKRILLRIYEERLGPVPASVRGALLAVDDTDRLTGLLPLFLSGTADDISRALLF